MTQLDNIIKRDTEQKKKLSVYDTYQFIPYADSDGHIVFQKDNLNKWLDFITQKNNAINVCFGVTKVYLKYGTSDLLKQTLQKKYKLYYYIFIPL